MAIRWNPRNKFNAVPTKGYASGGEAGRAQELHLLQAAGEITELREQPRFPLRVNAELVCSYKADFIYKDRAGRTIVEEFKGYKTRDYIIRKKLFMALNPGFLFKETTDGKTRKRKTSRTSRNSNRNSRRG